MAIRVKPPVKTRNEQIIEALREKVRAAAPQSPEMAVKKKAAELAALMAQLHGGQWRIQIDHDQGLVLIAGQGRLPQNP